MRGLDSGKVTITRLRRVAADECAVQQGEPCDAATLEAFANEPIVCPRQVVISDPMQGGHKAALLPATTQSLACWDMSGMFAGG